jgi:hypothetical protein
MSGGLWALRQSSRRMPRQPLSVETMLFPFKYFTLYPIDDDAIDEVTPIGRVDRSRILRRKRETLREANSRVIVP